MQKITVGVVYGGRSVEHEVSVISAVQAMHSLDTAKYNIVPIYMSKEGVWYTGDMLLDMNSYRDLPALLTKATKVYVTATCGEHKLYTEKKGLFGKQQELDIDVILPVTHGAHGEDGCLQGLLEMLNIPYAGPTLLGASVGMDKVMMKAVLEQAKIPLVPYMWFDADAWYTDKAAKVKEIETSIGYPVIVKPANLGSSVGINKASNADELISALDEAASFSMRLLVEKCVTELREINCSVLGLGSDCRASVCEEPITSNEFLTYADKYSGGGKGAKGAKGGGKGMSSAARQIPADLPAEVTAEIQRLAKASFTALDGAGVARIDFLLDKADNSVYVNEINTIPGSLSFYLWKPTGLEYGALLSELIDIAFRRQRRKDSLTFSYDSNILASAGGFKTGIKK